MGSDDSINLGSGGMRANLLAIVLLFLTTNLLSQEPILLDSTVRYDYLSGDTVRTERKIFIYNQDGQTTEERRQIWSQSRWKDDSRITNEYRGDLLVRVTNWNYTAGEWVPEDRIVNIYNSLDILAEVFTQEWNESLASWVSKTSVIFATEDGGQESRIRFVWSADQQNWLKVDSTISPRNDKGLVESDTLFQWIALAQSYLYESVTSYRYDSLSNLITTTRFSFSTVTLGFVPRSRDSFDYDSSGFQWLSQFDIWNGQQETWEPSLRIERATNGDGFLAASKIFFADFVSGVLLPTSRLEYLYTDGKDRGEADSLILSVKNIIYQGNIEVPDWKTHYYYSGGPITAVHLTEVDLDVAIYPNPANYSVAIQTSRNESLEYMWIGSDGRLWTSGIWRGQPIKSPAAGPSGIYYLILTSIDGKWSKSFPVKLKW